MSLLCNHNHLLIRFCFFIFNTCAFYLFFLSYYTTSSSSVWKKGGDIFFFPVVMGIILIFYAYCRFNGLVHEVMKIFVLCYPGFLKELKKLKKRDLYIHFIERGRECKGKGRGRGRDNLKQTLC